MGGKKDVNELGFELYAFCLLSVFHAFLFRFFFFSFPKSKQVMSEVKNVQWKLVLNRVISSNAMYVEANVYNNHSIYL